MFGLKPLVKCKLKLCDSVRLNKCVKYERSNKLTVVSLMGRR